MKKRLFVFLTIAAMIGWGMAPSYQVPVVRAASNPIPKINYALIVTGYYEYWPETWFIKWVLQNIFYVPRVNIVYLLANVGGGYPSYVLSDNDGYATLSNVRSKVQSLAAKTGNVSLFVSCHGGGWNSTDQMESGRVDTSGDELTECIIEGVPRGVDECITLQKGGEESEKYWDDDLKQDLASGNYASITIMLSACFAGASLTT